MRFLHWVFGEIGHVQIESPELDQQVRARYQPDIDQLTGLGFHYLCSDGESFALFRLLLVFPAIVLIAMSSDRLPMALRGGSILVGFPLLVSGTRSAFATSPDGRHVKFLTAFRDGTLLSSGNYADPTSRGPGIVRQFEAGTVVDTWAKHQSHIQTLEADGKQVDRRSDYAAYVEMSQKDTAAW